MAHRKREQTIFTKRFFLGWQPMLFLRLGTDAFSPVGNRCIFPGWQPMLFPGWQPMLFSRLATDLARSCFRNSKNNFVFVFIDRLISIAFIEIEVA